MYKKQEPFLIPCEVCGEMIPFQMSKSCQRCHKKLCILCEKFIDPFEPWWPGKWQQSMKRKLFDNPACPHCYDEIEKENEKNKKQEEDLEQEQERIAKNYMEIMKRSRGGVQGGDCKRKGRKKR